MTKIQIKPTPALILLAALLTLSACQRQEAETAAQAATTKALPPGISLIEEFSGEGEELSVPYAKYQLDNGLTVILHEDHSDPLVNVDVAYHVGSNREEPGRSGFAHFFEHMMFEGSAHVAEGAHGKIISNAGGDLNGTTNSDRTNYYETIPVNQLEIALWLEADRMGFLLEAVDEKKFEVQRETVKNERGQRVDNVPYGRVSETMMKNLYPPEHPYSWPVIGWTEDLNAATLEDLERFFLRWYGPNNAQLVIGGDIDRQQTLEWVAKYFGSIPRGPDVESLTKQAGQLDQDRYVTLEDNVHLPAIAMLFPTVYFNHPDEAPLDAAAKVLGGGKASLLYQRLVQSGRAVNAFVSHACRELACEMAFIVVQNPASGETLAEMEQAIRETLAEFAETGVSEDDLQKFKAQMESGQVFGMQSVAGKVAALAFSEMFVGDPKAVHLDLQRYAAVTREDVTRTFARYLVDQPAVILSVVPEGQPELAAHTPNYMPPTAQIEVRESNGTKEEAVVLRTVTDDFDRSIQPVPGVNPVVQLPPAWRDQLANGVPVLGVIDHETPTVSLSVMFELGQRDEPSGKAGLAGLMTSLMNEGSETRTAAEFTEALERIGAEVGISSGGYDTTLSMNTLSKHVGEAMALTMERLLQPAFLQEDFDRIQSRNMEGLVQARKSGPTLAGRGVDSILQVPGSPLAFPDAGLPETLAAITLNDVKAFYAVNLPARIEGVVVSSSLSQQETMTAIAALGELPAEPVERMPLAGIDEFHQTTIYLIDRPDAAQSSVRIVHPSVPYDATGDFYLAGLINFNLGGTFDSRINLGLREDKGWTYGAYTGFSGGREFGNFQFAAEINKDATAESISETLRQIERFASEGMNEEEFQYLQSALGQRDALRYETPGAKLGLLDQVLTYNLPLDYRRQQQAILQETDRETLNKVAARMLKPEHVAIVVAADVATVRPQLEALGIPIKMLDQDGFAVVATEE
ncbi:MAG: pitrilysin family protein [Xanthomonadales bacterium]|nr:pitrilysin family protein [Xanthomonadales bacterium]